MATAAVTVPGGAGASGVIPCPLPAKVEDAMSNVWGVFINHEGAHAIDS